MIAQNNNAVPESEGSDLTAQGACLDRGSLVRANGVYPVRMDSDGADWGPPVAVGAESGGVAGILKALQQRWLLALVVGLLCGSVGGTAMWFLKPAKYTVVGLLRVAPTEHRLLEGDKESEQGRTTFMKTQAALLTSPPILRGALQEGKVRQLGLVRQQAQPEAWLEKELKVGYIDDTELLRIALTGTDPKEMAILVNAIQASYMAQIVDLEHKRQLNLRDDLERIVLTAQDKLRKQRTELRGLAEITHTSDSQTLTTKQRNTLEEYAALKREFAGIRAQLRQAEIRLQSQKTRLKSPETLVVPDMLVDEYLGLDPGVQMQVAEVARAQSRALATEQTTLEGSSVRKKPQQALTNAKASLEKIREEKRPDIVKRLRQKIRDEAELSIGQIQEEMNTLGRQKQEMEVEVKRVSDEAERIGITSLDLEMKKGDIDQAENVVRQLAHEKEKLSIELQSTAYGRVSVYQQAEAPEIPNIKEHAQESVLVGLCAMSFGVFCVGFREFRARWISTADDVSKDLGMRVVGTLPDLSNWAGRSRSQLVDSENTASVRIMVESVDSIRAILTCSDNDASTRVLMITSAVSREGKTTLAAQLATSFAHSGKRTLLVDFDLRNPSLHRLLDQPKTPGVCEVLRGEVDITEAVRTTDVPGLFFLSAGSLSRPVLASCLHGSGEAFFEHLRAKYQFVAIDTCPILPVPDALLLGRYVDAAVFSVRPRVSRYPSVIAACARLRSVRVPLLGAVVNGVRPKKDQDYYRYVTQAKA
jgi:capsular exopolysaccharide synthesis family protein